jgi:hypothetical protein
MVDAIGCARRSQDLSVEDMMRLSHEFGRGASTVADFAEQFRVVLRRNLESPGLAGLGISGAHVHGCLAHLLPEQPVGLSMVWRLEAQAGEGPCVLFLTVHEKVQAPGKGTHAA